MCVRVVAHFYWPACVVIAEFPYSLVCVRTRCTHAWRRGSTHIFAASVYAVCFGLYISLLLQIKVTEEVAFASQPSVGQLRGIGKFGFSSIVCLRHPCEPGYDPTLLPLLEAQGIQVTVCTPDGVPASRPVLAKHTITLPYSGAMFQQSPEFAGSLECSLPRISLRSSISDASSVGSADSATASGSMCCYMNFKDAV